MVAGCRIASEWAHTRGIMRVALEALPPLSCLPRAGPSGVFDAEGLGALELPACRHEGMSRIFLVGFLRVCMSLYCTNPPSASV